MELKDFFIDVAALPQTTGGFIQIIFLAFVYGNLLTYASNLISDGSELLLLVPALSGIVGSVVLPILGAVPDGCIVLFSGLGPNAQEQLSVGVGALAGSTIMLLTVPWFLSILGGRVNVVNGKASYKSPKLPSPDYLSLYETGIGLSPMVNKGALFMLMSSLPYLVIQIAGLFYLNQSEAAQSAGEHGYAIIGLVITVIFFAGYLAYQYRVAMSESHDVVLEAHREHLVREAIASGQLSLLGAMTDVFKLGDPEKFRSESRGYQSISSSPAEVSPETLNQLKRILKPFFKKYDRNSNGTLDRQELAAVFQDLGEDVCPQKLNELFIYMDRDNSGMIDYAEFVSGVAEYVINHCSFPSMSTGKSNRNNVNSTGVLEYDGEKGFEDRSDDELEYGIKAQIEMGPKVMTNLANLPTENDDNGDEENNGQNGTGLDEEEDDEEEMPEDLAHLPPQEQQRRIKLRSLWMMGWGTFIVLLISDAMVDVLSEIGKRTGIPAFYVSFVLAPLASNASEVIASYKYAQKKTSASITISLSTLEGAVVMNNSFVLGIFMFLIVFKGLSWEFFAETTSILISQLVVAVLALKKTHTIFDGIVILSIYPLSLFLVSALESMGWN